MTSGRGAQAGRGAGRGAWRSAGLLAAGLAVSLGLGACANAPRKPGEDAGPLQEPPPPGCLDEDGDGAGLGSDCTASDCDDTDPSVASECGQDCGAHPDRKGCPCATDAPLPCYRGPAGTADVGVCNAGLARCQDGVWSGCDGQRLPAAESCDGADDDCDGAPDDGVLSSCGTCGPCESHCAGPEAGCAGFADADIHNLVETAEGFLTLDEHATTLHVIWPSSATEGKVFRVDTRTKQILGAYWTGSGHAGEWSSDSPSRTAVDDRGNVIIANRMGNGVPSSITKVAASPDDCPDRNGNGVVDTSTGWDDLLDFGAEDEWDDECILWHTAMPAGGARPIALYRSDALDGAGVELGWACTYDNMRCYQFEQESGELTGEEVGTPGVSPYGGAMDREGYFWVVGGPVGKFQVDDPDDSWELLNAGVGYYIRMIVDENDVPWFTGDDLYRYDRDAEEFQAAHLSHTPGHLASDGEGSIWVATYTEAALVFRVDNDEEMAWRTIDTPDTLTFGIAADFEGQVWTFGYPGGEGWGAGGSTSVVDIHTEEVEHVLHDCAGTDCVVGPYVRGDITGLQRKNALDPAGEWRGLFEGCQDGETTWHEVRVDADTPAGTSITVSARMADTPQGLAAASAVRLGAIPADGASFDLGTAFPEPSGLVQIDVLLESEQDQDAPVLRGVSVDYGCPPVIE